ncbi:MAG: asparagine--tRNA ligase [candidate division WOR-3 bacterium]|nr:asparagine--tRNA ligase [candidate division WOR-3 bacterium]MCX7947052.1 asparagine--tRNA ligase [candidate division WOR-3 bacterium]MDW8149907.1 asparagine--tRNA ligase [candidate division WOR-3 bacterium]
MKFVYIENLRNFVNEEVELRGWLYNKRESGSVKFIILRDGTGFVQCILSKTDVPVEIFERNIPYESSIVVRGIVREDKRAPGGYEVLVKDIKVITESENYPIPKVREDNIPDVDVLMPMRHLWIRSKKQWAILRIRSEVEQAIHDFFYNRGFIRTDAPILTPASVEGTTTLFEIDYFGKPAYLSQSGQLYVEATMMSFSKVYCFGPTFRAEKSKTRKHLSEFWMVEPEVAYAELEDVMDLAEELVEYIVERVLERKMEELKILERDIKELESVKKPFYRITYEQAIEKLMKKGFNIKYGDDFGADEEKGIVEEYDKPVSIMFYPKEIKPFYMKIDYIDKTKVRNFDMLVPYVGEIIGGSQREEDIETLISRIREENLPMELYIWYLETRKYGGVPHSGFGLGVERTVLWITKAQHIRETIPFPRLLEKIYP